MTAHSTELQLSSKQALPRQAAARWQDLAAAAFLFFAVLAVTLQVFRYTYDDAYITYRYAYNLATGHGFVYNPGETHLGTTSPLYGILVGVLSIPFPQALPLVGGWVSGAALYAAALALYLLAARHGHRLAGLLVTIPFILNPLVLDTFGGEAILLNALVLWALMLYGQGRLAAAGSLLGLAALTRGDAVLALGLVGLHFLITHRRIPWRMGLAFGIVLAAWSAFAVWRGGSLLPDTLSAKLAQTASGLWASYPGGALILLKIYFGEHIFYGQAPYAWLRLFLMLPLPGMVMLWLRRELWLPFAWGITHAVGYSLIGAPFYHWYYLPLALTLSILTGLGAEGLAAGIGDLLRTKLPPVLRFLIPVGLAALLLPLLWAPAYRWFYIPLLPAGAVLVGLGAAAATQRVLPGAAGSRGMNRVLSSMPGTAGLLLLLAPLVISVVAYLTGPLAFRQVNAFGNYKAVADWLKANTPEDASVGYLEVGIIGYYSERRIVDPLGLVTPVDPLHIRNNDFAWAYRALLPDYLLVHPRFHYTLGPYKQEPWFENCYKPVAQIIDMEIYQRCPQVAQDDRVVMEPAQLKNDNTPGELLPGFVIGQTFTAQQNNLRSVGLLLANYNQKLQGPLVFHLREASHMESGPDLRTINVDLSLIEDNSWKLFNFPPIRDSAGRQYYAYLEAPEATSGRTITAWSLQKDVYREGELMINHARTGGDLAFILYYLQQ